MSQNSDNHPSLMNTQTDERIYISHVAREARRSHAAPVFPSPQEHSRRARILREVQEAFSALRATQFEELRRENSSFGKASLAATD
jgi:hypothetical protein